MEAGGISQSDVRRGVLAVFDRPAGRRAHIVLMTEGERNLRAGGFYHYLVKPWLRRGRDCELVVRRETQCAGGARVDAEAAFIPSSPAGVAVRVNDAHGEDVKRAFICILAGLKDLEFTLSKIANRVMVLVPRHNVKNHFVGLDLQHHSRVGRCALVGVLTRTPGWTDTRR